MWRDEGDVEEGDERLSKGENDKENNEYLLSTSKEHFKKVTILIIIHLFFSVLTTTFDFWNWEHPFSFNFV